MDIENPYAQLRRKISSEVMQKVGKKTECESSTWEDPSKMHKYIEDPETAIGNTIKPEVIIRSGKKAEYGNIVWEDPSKQTRNIICEDPSLEHKNEFWPVIIKITSSANKADCCDFTISDERVFDLMQYLVQNRAITKKKSEFFKTPAEVLEVRDTVLSPKALATVLKIIQRLDCKIPAPAKVSSNDPRNSIGPELDDLLNNGRSLEELKELWAASHYLKISNLRLAIAAIFASLVFVEPSLKHFYERKKALGIEKTFDYACQQELKKLDEYTAIR